MAERTDELTRDGDGGVSVDDVSPESDEFGVDTDGLGGVGGDVEAEFGTDAQSTAPAETSEASSSRTGRVKQRAGDVFSPTTFALQLGGALTGAFVVGDLIPLIPFAGFLGICLMAGVMGTLSAKPRYLEAGVAGGASGALALFFGAMALSVVTGGMIPVVGAVVGAVAGLVGFYAGRDLRDGVTREI